jgi:hypothetical protein
MPGNAPHYSWHLRNFWYPRYVYGIYAVIKLCSWNLRHISDLHFTTSTGTDHYKLFKFMPSYEYIHVMWLRDEKQSSVNKFNTSNSVFILTYICRPFVAIFRDSTVKGTWSTIAEDLIEVIASKVVKYYQQKSFLVVYCISWLICYLSVVACWMSDLLLNSCNVR